MKTFTAREVNEISEKIVEELRASGANELQLNSIHLGYLNLYAELTLLQYAREDEDEATSL